MHPVLFNCPSTDRRDGSNRWLEDAIAPVYICFMCTLRRFALGDEMLTSRLAV